MAYLRAFPENLYLNLSAFYFNYFSLFAKILTVNDNYFGKSMVCESSVRHPVPLIRLFLGNLDNTPDRLYHPAAASQQYS
jgi:hypothetical protein